MIKDLILKSYFCKFTESWGIDYQTPQTEANAFEKFVNYTILSLDETNAFVGKPDLLDFCSTGGGDDAKLDGIGIKINGSLVGSKEDIDQIVSANKKIDVEFILIQSKEKTDFKSEEFNTFGIGAQNFFSDSNLPENESVKALRALKDYIYSESSIIRKLDENPSVSVYYVFCGECPTDNHTEAIKKIVKDNLSKCRDSLNEISVSIIDGNHLKKACKELENDYSVELNIRDIIPLTVSDNKKIKKAYTFTCDAKELLKLLCKEDNTIRRSLFNDNVRDYLGNKGGVNSEIEQTIITEPEMFLMCNNGITVVCSDFLQIRDKLVSIKDPQIVNGCQTCNSIYAQKDNPTLDRVQVLLKLICTDDVYITNKVVRGTNKQNQVLEESFETTKPFHQDLEEYFFAKRGLVRLYYERRNKQYSSDPTINKLQIVNLRVLTQTFVAMFLHYPHLAHRHEAKLLQEFTKEGERKIYLDSHSYVPYYICALTWYKFEEAFRKGILPKKAKTYKLHLCYIFTFVTGKYPINKIEKSEGVDKRCEALEKILYSEHFDDCLKGIYELFEKSVETWVNMGKSQFAIKDNCEFTDFLEESARKTYVNKSTNDNTKKTLINEVIEDWKSGKILSIRINNNKWFAFITYDKNCENVYFDSRAFKGNFNDLRPSLKVRFQLSSKRDNDIVKYFATTVELLKI